MSTDKNDIAKLEEDLLSEIEDYLDAFEAEKAYEEYLKNPKTISHDEFWKDLIEE